MPGIVSPMTGWDRLRPWLAPGKPLYLGHVRALHHQDELGRNRRSVSADDPPHNMPLRYNVCPTDPVDVVRERDGRRGELS
jgi:hypothetical protein